MTVSRMKCFEDLVDEKKDFVRIVNWFDEKKDRALVALSGGVDSAVVALAAKKSLGNNSLAATADYDTLSKEELSSARKIAQEIGIGHVVIKYNQLENQDFVRNDNLRCYHCRSELASYLVSEASRRDIHLIVDGTNLDDLSDYRPGIKAMRELGIRSPLVELGMDKQSVRAIAKFQELSVYNKPSNSCLASRIAHGISVTENRINRIEIAELFVKSIFSLKRVRVRDHSDLARIEVGEGEIPILFDIRKLELLNSRLKGLGFTYVTIDIGGYRGHDYFIED
jgi:pyridinium-3,5-biscarboxylic acid mononucleotide sulfurtransferase